MRQYVSNLGLIYDTMGQTRTFQTYDNREVEIKGGDYGWVIDNESGVSFRLFDKNNYWSEPATYDFGSSRKIVVELNNMKDKNGGKIDPSHLYIAGFWSTGGKPIVIANVSLAN